MRGIILTLFGLMVGLAAGVAASGVDWGFAVRARPATPAGSVVQWVDRAGKGDRLDLSVTRVGKQPAPKLEKMMEGCEPAASPLAASAQIAARCAA